MAVNRQLIRDKMLPFQQNDDMKNIKNHSLSLSIITINGIQCTTDFVSDLISFEEVAIRKQWTGM